MRVRDLTRFLAFPDYPGLEAWCIPNLGASTGQSLIGAISTGSHGGAFGRRPIADSVRALLLVGPGGRQHWIEPALPYSITSPASLATQLPSEVQISYDDELFYSALVSVGSFGIITELVIEVQQMFGQSQRVRKRPWSKVRQALKDGTAFTDPDVLTLGLDYMERHGKTTASGKTVTPKAEGFEILLNPYRISDNYQSGSKERSCLFVSRARGVGAEGESPPMDDYEAPILQGGGGSPLDYAPPLLGTLQSLIQLGQVEDGGPSEYRKIIDKLHQESRANIRAYRPTDAAIRNDPPPGDPTPGLSMELVITTAKDRHLKLIDALLDRFDELVADGKRYAGFFALRFTQSSGALLAMQNTPSAPGLRVCHIEVFGLKELHGFGFTDDGNMEGKTEMFVREFTRLGKEAGARLHWGQMHHLDRQRVAKDYETLHNWRRARTRLTSDGRARTFSNAFTRRTGLETYHEALTAVRLGDVVDLYAYEPGGRMRRMRVDPASQTLPAWKGVASATGFVKIELASGVAGPLTAAVTPDRALHLFAETATRRLKHVRNESATGLGAQDWQIKEHAIPLAVAAVTGPWAALAVGSGVRLFGVGPGGTLLQLEVPKSGGLVGLRIQPDFAKDDRFVHAVSPCLAGGSVHVIGAGASGHLLRGERTAFQWKWFRHRLKSPSLSPAPFPAGPTSVVARGDELHAFCIGRKRNKATGSFHHRLLWMHGSPNKEMWDWSWLPEAEPPHPHVDFVDKDKGTDDAFAVVSDVLLKHAEPVGPVVATVQSESNSIRVYARADTSEVLEAKQDDGGGWTVIRLGPLVGLHFFQDAL